ncbi:probable fructokinase-7 [Tanacetum coccineum]
MKSLVVCFGEMLIDFVPSVSGVSLAEASVFEKAPGGAPANVAVGISRLGGSSAFIGKVGDDQFGYMLADIMKENKVNNSGMRFDPKARTALAFISLKSDGEREFLFFRNPSADMLLQESELNVNLIKQVSEDKITFLMGADNAYDDNVVLKKLFHPNLKMCLFSEGIQKCKSEANDTFSGVEDAFVSGILSVLVSDLKSLSGDDSIIE